MAFWGSPWGIGFPWGGSPLIADHCDQAIARLMEQYRGQPLIEAIVCTFAERWQTVENVATAVLDGRSIDTAGGVQLDALGEWLDVPRFTANDEAYRLLLRFKISTILPNTATIPAILNIAIGLTDQLVGEALGATVEIAEIYPAAYCVTMPIQGHTLETLARSIMIDAHPAGVGFCTIVYTPTDFFGYSSDTGPDPAGLGGYESDTTPGDGGLMSSVDI